MKGTRFAIGYLCGFVEENWNCLAKAECGRGGG